MGNGARLGLTGVLALIVLLVAVWDKKNEELARSGGDAAGVSSRIQAAPPPASPTGGARSPLEVASLPDAAARSGARPAGGDDVVEAAVRPERSALTGTPYAGGGEGTADAASPRGPGPAGYPRRAPAPAGAGSSAAATPRQLVAADSSGTPAAGSPAARPAPTPGPTLAPRPAADEVVHVFGPQDTLWKLSERYLGSGTRWQEIHEANRDRIPRPDRIPNGTRLRIPGARSQGGAAANPPVPAPAPTPVAARPAAPTTTPPAARTYTVKSGDTLTAIARRELGSEAKVAALFEANRDRLSSPDAVREGQTLVIPASP